MSYHSLEDRLTKQVFAQHSTSHAPPDMPVVPESHQPPLRLLTRGAEKAGEAEIAAEPAGPVGPAARASSASPERRRAGALTTRSRCPAPSSRRGPEGTSR